MPERIQRRRTRGWTMPPGAVYVGRPTRWGNPWIVGAHATIAVQTGPAASWRDFGAIVLVRSLDEAMPLVDEIAAEHVEIAAADAERLAAGIRNAGAIFIGAHTPEAIGDYVAGSNHVLPTARSARFSSGLGVLDFMKRTTLLACDADALARLGPPAVTLARAEGLDAHALSITIRGNRGGDA